MVRAVHAPAQRPVRRGFRLDGGHRPEETFVPGWAWGYIGWSDEYRIFRDSPKEYDRAEPILLRALERPGLEDREDVIERLRMLREERAQARGKKRRRSRRRRKR